jgi:D-tyrosyl-tRNA(Tyr) deacylase
VEKVRARGVYVAQGEFQTDMLVRIHNDGPVTVLLDSKKAF